MDMVVHSFERPQRFIVGTVGPPGQRTFFLQAKDGTRVTSVALEKQQVTVLAERIDSLLDEVLRRGGETVVPAVAPQTLDDNDPLDQPIVEEFRVGTMTLAWDPEDDHVVIELFPISDDLASGDTEPDQDSDDLAEQPGTDLGGARLGAAGALGESDFDGIELDADDEIGDEAISADEVVIVKLEPGYARAFAQRAQRVVSAGRPPCPFCGGPLDPDGHLCPRANGFRRVAQA
jgi:uncharacterized repeat protein (TIGR03847 family)